MQKVAIAASKEGCIFENLLTELEVYLDHVDREDELYGVIRSAVENTRLPEHNVEVILRDVFQVYRPADELRYWSFDQKLHNKTLLFAGVKQSSLAATLKNGLRMPHKDGPVVPYPYGRGIYLTDCFSKAALASMASKEPQRVCVVLAEAALGDMHKA